MPLFSWSRGERWGESVLWKRVGGGEAGIGSEAYLCGDSHAP